MIGEDFSNAPDNGCDSACAAHAREQNPLACTFAIVIMSTMDNRGNRYWLLTSEDLLVAEPLIYGSCGYGDLVSRRLESFRHRGQCTI